MRPHLSPPPLPEIGKQPVHTERRTSVSRTLGIGVAAVAAVLFVNFGTLPVSLSLQQALVAAIVISVAMEVLRWIRRGVRRQARHEFTRKLVEYGGGLYGTIAVATWAYLAAMDVYADWVAAGSLANLLSSISLGWLIEQGLEAAALGLRAALWPWHWLAGNTAWMVAVAVWCFDGIRGPVQRWLASRRPAVAATTPPS
jgi:hypothetical protein